MFRDTVRRWLETCRLIPRSQMIGRIQPSHPTPEQLDAGLLVVVRDEHLDKWICFRCPGGCGARILLSAVRQRRPQWSARIDWLGRPTVEPSVRQMNACGCHFLVRRGRIRWCTDSGPMRQSSTYSCISPTDYGDSLDAYRFASRSKSQAAK